MKQKAIIIPILLLFIAAGCTKGNDPIIEPRPVAIDEPVVGEYWLELAMSGNTELFLMQGTLYGVARYSSDTLHFYNAEGEEHGKDGICTFGESNEVRLHTSDNAVLIQGHAAFVVNDVGVGDEEISIALRLGVDDSVICTRQYHLVASHVSASLRFSTDTTQIAFGK